VADFGMSLPLGPKDTHATMLARVSAHFLACVVCVSIGGTCGGPCVVAARVVFPEGLPASQRQRARATHAFARLAHAF
jgi:hypothetical protein